MEHIAFWTERSSADESLRLIKELALSHAQQGGAQGDVIASLITGDDFPRLCGFELDYSICTVSEARNCRQALAFFKKCTYLPLKGVDRKRTAIDKFIYAELKCRDTNEVLNLRDQGLFNLELWADAAITRAKAKISRILGPLPKFSELDFKFGRGATTLTKKSEANIAQKLEDGFSCSEALVPYVHHILDEIPAWELMHLEPLRRPVKDGVMLKRTLPIQSAGPLGAASDEQNTSFTDCAESYQGYTPVFVTPGRVSFVPKDAYTDRSIIVEGSLNVLVQGAIGRYMFARLKRYGIDLSDQGRNRELAKIGSLTGDLSTLDLVSASDMMASAIVRELLPWEWWFFLSTARSATVLLQGKTMELEKFSSMGNGFTFPLQSLIFYALASAVSGHDIVSVYGDDIICHTDHSPRVMRLLEICGFEINRKKSYTHGSFRESCGADYISGFDIRPWYHREVISPKDLFRLHNFYVRHGDEDRARLIVELINPCLRIYGPEGFGDGHLLGDWIPRRHKRHESHGYGGVLFDTFKERPVKDGRSNRRGDRVLPLYSIYVRENADRVLPANDDIVPEHSEFSDAAWELIPFSLIDLATVLGNARRMQSNIAVEPLSERLDRRSGAAVKQLPMPGTNGYVRVSIYTFNAG